MTSTPGDAAPARELPAALLALNSYEAQVAAAAFERIFPAGADGPGAAELGVVTFLDRALMGAYSHLADTYRYGLAALDSCARRRHGRGFPACAAAEQDLLLAAMERGDLPDFVAPPPAAFFALLRAHCQEGLFADPAYGGNRDKGGWRWLGHPGIYFENSAEENMAAAPVTKGGRVQSLADVGFRLDGGPREPQQIPGYDPQAGARPPAGPADVVLVGVGAANALVARIFARAGLKVVGLEAGPYRTSRDFVPDELGSAYYCRGGMGPKYLSEAPRWRLNAGQPTVEATFSLGRMMNSVGGSVIHWGGALRRCHPHHFRFRSHVRDRWGDRALPEGHTLVDWPYGYDELEAYYTRVEYEVGVTGDGGTNPFLKRSKPFPLPPMRPFRMGEIFKQAARTLGLHPYSTPVAVHSEPYNGFPATTYCAWMGGFGPFNDERWTPGMTWVPEALATGNFALKTGCRVTRVLTDGDGHASGVEYVDALGEVQVQAARTVVLGGYTLENVRLLLLSGGARHQDGLGNTTGQVGRHLITKMWMDVYGDCPGVIFNAHTGPSGQMCGLDDFVSEGFDCVSHGFVGGATPNIENQRLPIQIAREVRPEDVPGWGQAYKDHIRKWQQFTAVRIQPDALPYHANFMDLDPRHRDRSGLGLPVVRITYDQQPNERRQMAFFAEKGAEIARAMGATRTWCGPSFGGLISSHELGGARMGEDPAGSVVDPHYLEVHDTPGLHVYGTAVFPSCHGVNPTLTMWAVIYRAAEQLVTRLRRG